MTSPCRNCEHINRDKNHPGCVNCPERSRFLNGVRGMPEPVNHFVPKPKVKKIMTTEPEKRICAQCGGPPKDILEFRKVKGGHHAKTCHVCMSDNLEAKRTATMIDKAPTAEPVVGIVEIDFSKCPNLLARLEKAAIEELRTFHDQVLWALVSYLKNRR